MEKAKENKGENMESKEKQKENKNNNYLKAKENKETQWKTRIT